MLRALILLAGSSAVLSGCTAAPPKTLPCGHPARAETEAAPLPERSRTLSGTESEKLGSDDLRDGSPPGASSPPGGHHNHHGHAGMK